MKIQEHWLCNSSLFTQFLLCFGSFCRGTSQIWLGVKMYIMLSDVELVSISEEAVMSHEERFPLQRILFISKLIATALVSASWKWASSTN